MDTPLLTPPDLDDETVVKLSNFLYEIVDAFEAHYCYQILRHNGIYVLNRYRMN